MGKVVIMQSCRMSTRTLLTGFPLDTTVSSMSRIVTSKAECFLLKKVFPPQPSSLSNPCNRLSHDPCYRVHKSLWACGSPSVSQQLHLLRDWKRDERYEYALQRF